MSELNIIDLNNEFSLLVKLINSLWDGCDNEKAEKALRASFEQGLEDAKLWIDEHAGIRIAEVLNGNDEICFPLENRRDLPFEGDNSASIYDALCRFDNNLRYGLAEIHRSVTGYGRWDYSKNADTLCRELKRSFGSLEVTPKDQDRETQDAIAKAYPGYHASEAGSFPTPQRFLKAYVEYSRDEQGRSLFRSLFSTVYSHALYCAKTKNTQTLVNDLLPIYSKRNEPLNFDNGDEIMSIANTNPFVKIIHKMKPFKFSSMEKYLEAREQARKVKAERAAETPEEKEQRLKDIVKLAASRSCSDNKEAIMIIVDVADLNGAALDWAVAVCENQPVVRDPMGFETGSESGYWIWDDSDPKNTKYQRIGREYSPSSNWAQAGPIMERHDIYPCRYYGCAENNPNVFQAGKGISWIRGETPLIAAMRSLIRSNFGNEIDVPETLLS